MFRKQFKLTLREEKALRRICYFIIKCYVQAWFSTTNAIEVPMNDISFLKTLFEYKPHDKDIVERAIHKMIGHLWYLSEECAAFSIYDDRINNDVRRKMAHILLKECIPSQSINEMEIEQLFEEKNKLAGYQKR